MARILITGGSRGIGRATALLAARRGWSTTINYINDKQAAINTLEEVTQCGGTAIITQGDVSNETDVIRMFDTACMTFGGLDGVVVNAGIGAPSLPLAAMSIDRLKRMFEVNTLGAYLCARQAARMLPRHSGGSIVLVSSAAARLGSPFEFVDYAGSKGALDTLTVGLAKELGGTGIRVNTVRPGLIETEIHASGGQPDRAQRLGGGTPIGRAGRPEEVAEAIIWLLSDAASYITGAILDVAGGR